jgi:hypothetical protein
MRENHIMFLTDSVHCTENRIYVFPEQELHGLSPNSFIHVSVIDLYFTTIGPHIWLLQNRQTDPGNMSISNRYMSVGIERQNIIHNSVLATRRLHSLISGNT